MYTFGGDQGAMSGFIWLVPVAPPPEGCRNITLSETSAFLRAALSPINGPLQKFLSPGKVHMQNQNQKAALTAITISCISVFLTALDQTVVVTALPRIIVDLQIPITQLDHASWIIGAYLLGFILAMPLMGRVSDIYGRRRIFLLCLIVFGIGSVFCGLAPFLGQSIDLNFLHTFDTAFFSFDTSSPGLIWLIAARLIQAIGGGAVVPVAMAIAGDFYEKEKRGLALGVIGAVTEAGGVLGPLYGAIIVKHLGWEYIFYLNVPLVIILMILVWIYIPRSEHLHEGVDWTGTVLLGLSLACLSLGLAQQSTSLGTINPASEGPRNNPVMLVLALLFLGAFVLVERRVRWPVVELAIFKRLAFSAASLVSLLVGIALIIAMVDIPIFVETVMQASEMEGGLALLRLTAMIPIGAVIGGWLCSRISCRLTGIGGLLLTAVGFFLMSRWPLHVDWWEMTTSTFVAGLGFGLVIAPIGTTAINAVRETQAGIASAVVTALRMVGMMLGLAVLTSWAMAYFKYLVSTYPSLPGSVTTEQFVQWSAGYAGHVVQSAHTVYCSVFFLAMLLCLVAVFPAFFLWKNRFVGTEELQPVLANRPGLSGELPEFTDDKSVTAPEQVAFVTTAETFVLKAIAASGMGIPAMRTGELTMEPPVPEGEWQQGGNQENGGKKSKMRRSWLIVTIVSIFLVPLCIGSSYLLMPFFIPPAQGAPQESKQEVEKVTPTVAPPAGPRKVQLALDKEALTSVFAAQLDTRRSAISGLKVEPLIDSGLHLSLNLSIDANGIQRVMPVDLYGRLAVDQQHNLRLHLLRFLRDGVAAKMQDVGDMEAALNQLLTTSLMPALQKHFKGIKLLDVQTSKTVLCGEGAMMLVLLIETPPVQDAALVQPAQSSPATFCLNGPLDLNKFLPVQDEK